MLEIYNALRPTKFGEIYKNKFEVIEKSLEIIAKNMNEITTNTNNSKWNQLKEIPKAETIQKEAYNLIIKDIKTCYLQVKDLDEESLDNIKILNFKEKRTISDKQLKNFFADDTCIKNFEKYNTTEFSKNKDLNEKLQKQISLIINTESGTNYNEQKFMDALNRESNIIHNIANLSGWLKIEYDTYK